VLEANDAMKKIMGLPLDAELPVLNFFNIEVMTHVGISPQLSKCIETKEIVNGEIKYKSSRKTDDIYLVYSFVPVLNHNGEIETIIGYVSDLTQQKRAESESRKQADFLKLVINTIKTPFFVKDEEHKWVMLNDAAVEMMGKPREVLLGKSDFDLYPTEQANVFWECDELVFKTGSHSNEEMITWSDGTLHSIVTHKQLYIEKSSGKKYIVGTIHDISSYKKIEDDLRASDKKYRELFNNANDFIITLEPNGKITNANQTLLNYLQTDLESLVQHNVFELFTEENIVNAYAIRDKVLKGSYGSPFEIEAIGVAGQPVIYEVKASLLRENRKIVGVQCVFSDITERREASLKLEEYNKNLLELNNSKDKFFSIIAHDLRNPYSSILGFAELLFEDLEEMSKDEIRDSLKIIRNSAKNSLNLLEDLLAWSRLETGRIPFALNKVELIDVIDEVVDVLFSLAYRKQINIINEVEPGVLLLADKNMLTTILNNLIMNAIKYTPIGGKIRIYTGEYFVKSDQKFITISVADTGVGMDPELVDRLFTLNKLQSSPGTEKEQGTGLGLILSREMIEKHGGTIRVDSSPDKGSIFSFSIPVFHPEDDKS
jgi:PAS domain S-box-containing protein